jgi:hypothetical protein
MKTEEAKTLLFFGLMALLVSMFGREERDPQKKTRAQSEKIILPRYDGV